MGNFIHEVEKKKGAGTDSIQLFSIKPFMASIKYNVSVLLDYWFTQCAELKASWILGKTI